jgi:hypothetical protein
VPAAQAKPDSEARRSLRHFVQEFYDWYVPKAQEGEGTPAWKLALAQKHSAFDPPIVRALREDSAAQIKSLGEVVGLDFDPFLNSQDPSPHYEVGEIAEKDGDFWVDIHGVESGKKSEKPGVIAEVSRRSGRWIFVNFHYQENRDLLATLKLLRETRGKRHN